MTVFNSVLTQLIAGEACAVDAAMLAASPVAVVPGHSPFVPLDAPGRRVLLARDGVYLEARSDVLWCCLRLAECALPFGALMAENPSPIHIKLVGAPLDRAVFDRLVSMAEVAHPKEMAALVVRDQDGHDHVHVPAQCGALGAVTYDDALIRESRLLIDAHSHGPYGHHFSSVDDASDRSRIGPHISVVFGHCESNTSLRFAARLCVGSYLIPLDQRTLGAIFLPNPARLVA